MEEDPPHACFYDLGKVSKIFVDPASSAMKLEEATTEMESTNLSFGQPSRQFGVLGQGQKDKKEEPGFKAPVFGTAEV